MITKTKDQFVLYLRERLIPDLRESGCSATAEDFEIACRFIETGDSSIRFCEPVHDEIGSKFFNEWKTKP